MSTSNTTPLGEGELARLNEGIAKADEAIRQAELAQRAGIDIGQRLDQARSNRERLAKIKQTYFPNR